MSRTYRNCNKDGTPNDWARYCVKPDSFRSKEEGVDQQFLSFLIREKHRGSVSVPKNYLKEIKRSYKARAKRNLIKALKHDSFDDFYNEKYFKDAGYLYW